MVGAEILAIKVRARVKFASLDRAAKLPLLARSVTTPPQPRAQKARTKVEKSHVTRQLFALQCCMRATARGHEAKASTPKVQVSGTSSSAPLLERSNFVEKSVVGSDSGNVTRV